MLACSCGIAGCDSLAPIIEYAGKDEQLVVWSDFRHFTGVFNSPTTDEDVNGGNRANMSTLIFDRMQYETALFEALADRTWESPGAQTARLLSGMLETDGARLRAAGLVRPSAYWEDVENRWSVYFASPPIHRTETQERAEQVERFRAYRAAVAAGSLPPDQMGWVFEAAPARYGHLRPWETEPHQTRLTLETDPGDPPTQAADLYRQLWAAPIDEWEQCFHWIPPYGEPAGDDEPTDE